MIRQPIISVMGHVDHGKTSLLDKIRSTAIAAKEAGGITQHIGASEVPIEAIKRIGGAAMAEMKISINLPGLLFIDTPGHEAFTSLRKRGGSVSDMAIVVVDITKGFEPQTIEAIEILKSYKTPFIVAANKIDLITGWHASGSMRYSEAIKKQSTGVEEELTNKLLELVGNLSELGFTSDIYSNVKNFQKELAIVPVSAKTGEGIAELLILTAGLAQKFLEAKLTIEVNGPAKGSILERKEIKGLGTVIDVIIYDGTLHVNDMIAFATSTSIVQTKVKAILKPKPLSEIRDSKGSFTYVDEVSAACGVRISANDLEGAIPGSPIIQATDQRYVDEIKADIGGVFEVEDTGVVLKTDSIGSLEAISKLFLAAGFHISKKEIGNVTRRDVLDAFGMKAKDPLSAVVVAFSVKVDKDAEEAAQDSDVKIISTNIIYKLLDDYSAFVDERRKAKAKTAEESITLPAKIEVLSSFRASHPAIFGVEVLSGRIKPGYTMMDENGEVIGRIKGIQNEKAPLEGARKGDRIAVSMPEPTFGRQINENQILYTRLSESDIKMLTGEFANLLSDEEKTLLNKIVEIEKKLRGW